MMPEMDGLTSTRLIREMGYSAPIVALTAFADEGNMKDCIDSGMDFFLPKPIKRPALKQVLKRYCATIPEAAEEPESPSLAKKTDDKEALQGFENSDGKDTAHVLEESNGKAKSSGPIISAVNGSS